MAIVSGNTTEDCRIIVIDESTWAIEKQVANVPAGDYVVNYLTTGPKIVLAKSLETGDCKSYGQVSTVGDPIPDGPYAYYRGDDIVSTSNWPDETGHANLTVPFGNQTISVHTDGPNEHKYMRFGGNSGIQSGAIGWANPCTIISVFRYTASNYIDANRLYSVGDRTGNCAFHVQYNAGASQIAFKGSHAWDGYGDYPVSLTAYDAHTNWPGWNSWIIQIVRYSHVTNGIDGAYTAELRKNGVHRQYGTTLISNFGGTKYIAIGHNDNMGASYDHLEFIYYQRCLNNEEVDMTERYLKGKYNIS